MKLYNNLKNIFPKPFKINVYYGIIKFRSYFDLGNTVACNICDKHYSNFADFNNRRNVMCPNCFSLERHRLLYDYLKTQTDIFSGGKHILHFAAEKCLAKVLEKNNDYLTADLMNQFIHLIEVKPKYIMSVTNISFDDNLFDYVICNHVLEHVQNDILAISQIYSVLKPGGQAILQVPINFSSKITLEEISLTRKERRMLYGSPDHIRYYAEGDYLERLSSAGFSVAIADYEFSDDIDKHKIDQDEKIYLIRKPIN